MMNKRRNVLRLLMVTSALACGAREHALTPGSSGQDSQAIEGMPDAGSTADGMAPSADAMSSLDDGVHAPDGARDAPLSVDLLSNAAICGNGVLDPGEECDPPGTCPTACPAHGCTTFVLQGSASRCNARCVESGTQTICASGDACCPASCNTTNDSDCSVRCGDGVKSGQETCDPLSTCPTTCPAMGCQLRKLVNQGTCSAECVNDRQQTDCKSGDGCCPAGCSNNEDGDCARKCGNGVVEQGETCDPATTCAALQANCVGDKDTVRTSTGSANNCTYVCKETVRACGASDGFCPTNCQAGSDPDCKKATGQACSGAGECSTGVCANGFCCNQGCSMACYSCAGSATGQANGTCAPVTTSSICSPRTCHNGDVAEGRCAGGSCQLQTVQVCSSSEQCTGSSCVATCGNDGQMCCLPNSLCNSASLYCDLSATCRQKLTDASACDAGGNTHDSWCRSNYCGRAGFCLPCGGLNQNCCTSGTSACNSGLFCNNGCANNKLDPNDKDSLCKSTPSDPSFCPL
jgi:hypothetical protein